MKPLLLQPTDVLFFRDGRPMSGSLSGHGAAWPLPHVISHAFHAALHRADVEGVHTHRLGRSGKYEEARERKFGSLTTAGPFPVHTEGTAHTWFFPRPLDAADRDGAPVVVSKPLTEQRGASSLPHPLRYPVAATMAPDKSEPCGWWSEGAWNACLGSAQRDTTAVRALFKRDSSFAATEHSCGISMDSETGSAIDGMFYSASYLRLKDDWRLGITASAPDKKFRNADGSDDLIGALLDPKTGSILVGGQQRICSVMQDKTISGRLPLPLGRSDGFEESPGRHLVKWVLLTPAIFPRIEAHPGGFCPSWVDHVSGEVMLLDGPGKNQARRLRGRGQNIVEGKSIDARLVAALTGKPIPVTGWALPNGSDRPEGGAKSTHLAVPAGSVYYFECADAAAASKLAAALNWHGESPGTEIRNRRSSLMGEKGFGLGVCGVWTPHTSILH